MSKEEIYYANLDTECGWWAGLYGTTEILGFDINNNNLYLIFKVVFNKNRNIKTEEDGIALLNKFINTHTFDKNTTLKLSRYHHQPKNRNV